MEPEPDPCLICGSTAPLPIGESRTELYVYTARLHRHEHRVDIDVATHRDRVAGRVCTTCMPIILAAIKDA